MHHRVRSTSGRGHLVRARCPFHFGCWCFITIEVANALPQCGSGICAHSRGRSACSICRPAGAYKTYVRHEKENGTPLPYNFMTLETFVSLVSQSCHWCGRTPERANGMGVDRKDNSLGHVEGNLHPCCSICNYSRRHASPEEWGAWVLDMAAFHNQ